MPDTVRTIDQILALLADNATGAISAQDLRDGIVSLDDTGWAQYSDTVYTEASPFSVVADTDTVLPNNAGSKIETQKPRDVNTFYNGATITGRDGDGITIRVDFAAKPTSAASEILEFWFDIGGSIGRVFPQIISFPKGNGIERRISFTVSGYTLGTWESNGATAYIKSDGPVEVYDISYVITRTHRGSR